MAGNTPFRNDPAYQAAWTELLLQLRAAGARDAAFWAALGRDVAANERAREAHAEAWSQAQGDWPTAMQRYRWWMQEHADLSRPSMPSPSRGARQARRKATQREHLSRAEGNVFPHGAALAALTV